MKELVFLLEEASAEAMLRGLLPRLLSEEICFRCIVFEGKQDLHRQLVRRLRGYRNQEARFIIVRDQDAADCRRVKMELRSKCLEAEHPEAVVRIACHELESWYLADLAAVDAGLGTSIKHLQQKSRFRQPDSCADPVQELKRIAPTYQKIAGSRAIGPKLDLENRRSPSFGHFVASIRKLIAADSTHR